MKRILFALLIIYSGIILGQTVPQGINYQAVALDQNGQPIGWLTNYGARNSFETQYLGTALKDYGEQHLATLVILKSLLSRSDHSHSQLIYDDIYSLSFLAKDALYYESLLFTTEHVLQGLNNSETRYDLLQPDQVSVTLNNMGYTKQNIQNNSYINTTQKQTLENQIDSLVVFVNNM